MKVKKGDILRVQSFSFPLSEAVNKADNNHQLSCHHISA